MSYIIGLVICCLLGFFDGEDAFGAWCAYTFLYWYCNRNENYVNPKYDWGY